MTCAIITDKHTGDSLVGSVEVSDLEKIMKPRERERLATNEERSTFTVFTVLENDNMQNRETQADSTGLKGFRKSYFERRSRT